MTALSSSLGAVTSGEGVPYSHALAQEPDPVTLRTGIALLQDIPAGHQLLAFKNLILNNGGTWTVPESPVAHQPVLYEAQYGGVSAIASDPSGLPLNWIRAALNTLSALEPLT